MAQPPELTEKISTATVVVTDLLADNAPQPVDMPSVSAFFEWLCALGDSIWSNVLAAAVELLIDVVFFPLVPHVTTPAAVASFFHAMRNVTYGTASAAIHRKLMFMTTRVRDEIFVPLVRYATDADATYWMLRAMTCISYSQGAESDQGWLFGTESARDSIFIPLAVHATSPLAAQWLFHAIRNVTFGSQQHAVSRKAVFVTEAVRDGIFAKAADHVTTAEASYWFFRALACINSNSEATETDEPYVFATTTVRDDLFVRVAPHATSTLATQWLFTAMRIIDKCCAGGARTVTYATPAVRDHVFLPLVRCAADDGSATALLAALKQITHETVDGQITFAKASVRDGLFLSLARRSLSIVLAACDVLCTFVGGTDAEAAARMNTFATVELRDQFLIPALDRATIVGDVKGLLAVVVALAQGDDAAAPRRRTVFSTGEVNLLVRAERHFGSEAVPRVEVAAAPVEQSGGVEPTVINSNTDADNSQVSPVLLAEFLDVVREGNSGAVLELLRQKPTLAISGEAAMPPLHHAVECGHLDVVRLLVETGLLEDDELGAAGHLAAEHGFRTVTQFLISAMNLRLRAARAATPANRSVVSAAEVDPSTASGLTYDEESSYDRFMRAQRDGQT